MTSNIKLEIPHLALLNSYVDALREGHFMGISPKADERVIQSILTDPDGFITSKQPDHDPTGIIQTPDGSIFEKVPYEWLWFSVDGEFVGDVSLRLKLNPLLENFGGHIGYGVRPSQQGKGWATRMLAATRQWASDNHGLHSLLVTCSDTNPASEKVIQKNGGRFLREGRAPYGYDEGITKFYVLEGD